MTSIFSSNGHWIAFPSKRGGKTVQAPPGKECTRVRRPSPFPYTSHNTESTKSRWPSVDWTSFRLDHSVKPSPVVPVSRLSFRFYHPTLLDGPTSAAKSEFPRLRPRQTRLPLRINAPELIKSKRNIRLSGEKHGTPRGSWRKRALWLRYSKTSEDGPAYGRTT